MDLESLLLKHTKGILSFFTIAPAVEAPALEMEMEEIATVGNFILSVAWLTDTRGDTSANRFT